MINRKAAVFEDFWPKHDIRRYIFQKMNVTYPVIISEDELFWRDVSQVVEMYKQNNGTMMFYRPASLLTNHRPNIFCQKSSTREMSLFLVWKGSNCEHIAGGAPYDLFWDISTNDLEKIFDAIMIPLGKKYYKRWGNHPNITAVDAHRWPVLCESSVSSAKCLQRMISKWDRPYGIGEFYPEDWYSQIEVKCHQDALAACVFQNVNDEHNLKCQCLYMMWQIPAFSLELWNTGYWKLEEVSRTLNESEVAKCGDAFSPAPLKAVDSSSPMFDMISFVSFLLTIFAWLLS